MFSSAGRFGARGNCQSAKAMVSPVVIHEHQRLVLQKGSNSICSWYLIAPGVSPLRHDMFHRTVFRGGIYSCSVRTC